MLRDRSGRTCSRPGSPTRASTCELRGALDSPYGLTVGELARVDVYVPDDQVDEASLVLLVDEVDEADEILDDDRPPIRGAAVAM